MIYRVLLINNLIFLNPKLLNRAYIKENRKRDNISSRFPLFYPDRNIWDLNSNICGERKSESNNGSSPYMLALNNSLPHGAYVCVKIGTS